MSARVSIQVFGVYLIAVAGLGLMVLPDLVLGLFGLSAGDGAWVRMVGMLASVIGAYYLLAARADNVEMFRLSVPVRIYAAGFMVLMYVAGALGPGILLFAAIDLLGVAWTWAALRTAAG